MRVCHQRLWTTFCRKLSSRQASSHSVNAAVLTLVHKTEAFVPRVLSALSDTPSSPKLWGDLLSNARNDLSSLETRPAKVAVYGTNKESLGPEVVSVLLSDAFGDVSENKRIRDRWKDGKDSQIQISTSGKSKDSITSSLSFLRRHNFPVELTETYSPLTVEALQHLLSADVSVIVCNPLLMSPKDLPQSLLLSPSSILLLTSGFPTSTELQLKANDVRVISTDPMRALDALDAISQDSESSMAIQKYQDGFLASNMGAFIEAIELKFACPDQTGGLQSLRKSHAISVVHSSLSQCLLTLELLKLEADQVSGGASNLRELSERECEKIEREVSSLSNGQISRALERSETAMRDVTDKLSWWKMLRQVDDVGTVVSLAVEQSWCRDLEKQLLWQTGWISKVQESLTMETFSLLDAQRDKTTLPTEVLRNALEQLRASQFYEISPGTLTTPIQLRRSQIIEYPTATLQVAAQNAVLSMFGGIAGGVGLSWVGWLGWLSTENYFLSFLSIQPNTGMALGVFLALAAVRHSVGKWEKAKKMWWEDWKRIQAGMERDLARALQDCTKEKMAVIPRKYCDGVAEIVEKRREQVDDLEEEHRQLWGELESIRGK